MGTDVTCHQSLIANEKSHVEVSGLQPSKMRQHENYYRLNQKPLPVYFYIPVGLRPLILAAKARLLTSGEDYVYRHFYNWATISQKSLSSFPNPTWQERPQRCSVSPTLCHFLPPPPFGKQMPGWIGLDALPPSLVYYDPVEIRNEMLERRVKIISVHPFTVGSFCTSWGR